MHSHKQEYIIVGEDTQYNLSQILSVIANIG